MKKPTGAAHNPEQPRSATRKHPTMLAPTAVPAHLLIEWDTLTRSQQWRGRQLARYMALRPDSVRKLPPAARGLADAVLNRTILPHKSASLTTPLRPSTREAIAAALDVWLSELLYAAAWGNWTAHSLRRASFKKLAIGHQAFVDCKAALEHADLIVAVAGQPQMGMLPGRPPMFRPTPKLLEVAAAHGVTAAAVAAHFGVDDLEAA
jgi:hypothetical protein